MRVSNYAKSIIAAVSSILLTAQDLLTDDIWTSADSVRLVGAILTTICVWAVPNTLPQNQ